MARGRKRLIAGWGLVGTSALTLLALIASGRYSFELSWAPRDKNHLTYRGVSVQQGGIGATWGSAWKEPVWIAGDDLAFEIWCANFSDRRPIVHRSEDFNLDWWVPSGVSGNIGIAYAALTEGRGHKFRSVGVLLWPIAVIALGVGTPLLLSARRLAKRNRIGLCPACGYDMKGLAAGAGCPECGKAAATR